MDGKNIWRKTGFGILFVAACFTAMYILMAFHGKILLVLLAAVILLTSAFLFLNEVFTDKAKKWMQEEEEPEALEQVFSGNSGDGEFRLKIVKHMKEMENGQKELIDILKKQNTMLLNQMEGLEQGIYMLSEKQANQTKSVIKFNKENARQLAISERETLEYIMHELKKAIEDNAGDVRPVSREKVPEIELEELVASELFEVSELPGDDEYEGSGLPAPEVIPDLMEEPAVEEILPVAEESVAEEILPVAEESVAEEILPVVEEPVAAEEPAADPFASLGGDPNAMMTADDIAKLFAMNAPAEESAPAEPVEEEPVAEETEIPELPDDFDLSALFEDMAAGALEEEAAAPAPVKEEEPANDPLAGLGGDPNAMMTPEDIAKLLASMGQ